PMGAALDRGVVAEEVGDLGIDHLLGALRGGTAVEVDQGGVRIEHPGEDREVCANRLDVELSAGCTHLRGSSFNGAPAEAPRAAEHAGHGCPASIGSVQVDGPGRETLCTVPDPCDLPEAPPSRLSSCSPWPWQFWSRWSSWSDSS